MTTEPSVVLVHSGDGERWTIEIRGFAQVLYRVGDDAINAFCRCFVHADRLTSLIGFAHFSEREYGQSAPAFHRDLQTMVWFVVGTLRELAIAVRDLRSALAKRKLLTIDSDPWQVLAAIEKRWEDDPVYREMRNKVAFHVDEELTQKGLRALAEKDLAVLVQGDGRKQRHSFLSLGLDAVFMGSNFETKDFEIFMENVGNDQGVAQAIQGAFLDVLKSAGIPWTEEGQHQPATGYPNE